MIVENKSKRDDAIDVLRGLAILCIILAHSLPPAVVAQLRNFDVVLMVFLMGVSFQLSKRPIFNYWNYIQKRFKRLVVSTWKFLTAFYFFFFLYSVVFSIPFDFLNLRVIAGSFSLLDGIGYVWIMKVFFLIALILPFISKFNDKVTPFWYFSIFSFSLIVYHLLTEFFWVTEEWSEQSVYLNAFNKFYKEFVLPTLGYGLIVYLALRFYFVKTSLLIIYTLIAGTFLVAMAISTHFQVTQFYKYPPQVYYLSYGLFATLILVLVLRNKNVLNLLEGRFFRFLSVYSARIYFWHIFLIYLFNTSREFDVPLAFIFRLLFLAGFALLLSYLHTQIIEKLKSLEKFGILMRAIR